MNPRRTALLIAVLSLPCIWAHAQSHESGSAADDLFKTVSALDAQLFDAYNKCDLEKFGALLADDLEFYHDRGGLARGKQATIDGVKNNICGKVQRELVPGSLEVYPIHDFGAVEIGVHRFYHPNGPKPDTPGEAKFVHIWQLKDGVWKVTRVISIDHHSVQ